MTFLHKRVGKGAARSGSRSARLRELNGFSLEQVSHDTKIRDTILRALEEDPDG